MQPVTNITGWALQFTLKRHPADAVALVTKTTAGGGITVTDAVNGLFTINMLSADTTAAGVGDGGYVYDVQRVDSGNRIVLAFGPISIMPQLAL